MILLARTAYWLILLALQAGAVSLYFYNSELISLMALLLFWLGYIHRGTDKWLDTKIAEYRFLKIKQFKEETNGHQR